MGDQLMVDSLARARENNMTAKFERVAESIRGQIRAGDLRPGDRLPTTQELIGQYGVSYGTLRSALLVLKSEGLIQGEPGVGVYVAERPGG